VGELVILPPSNPDAFGIGTDIIKNYPSRFLHNLRFEFQTGSTDKYRFYFGIDNVTDQLPPFGLTGTGAGGGIFDAVGRFYYAGARIDF
jgi:outer membrane receptor protein involved in Fe transport